jgi:hypothetical protein
MAVTARGARLAPARRESAGGAELLCFIDADPLGHRRGSPPCHPGHRVTTTTMCHHRPGRPCAGRPTASSRRGRSRTTTDKAWPPAGPGAECLAGAGRSPQPGGQEIRRLDPRPGQHRRAGAASRVHRVYVVQAEPQRKRCTGNSGRQGRKTDVSDTSSMQSMVPASLPGQPGSPCVLYQRPFVER